MDEEEGLSWTQPCCDDCWDLHNRDRTPITVSVPEPERCAWCGEVTVSGIYVRANPNHVLYPATDELM